MRNTVLIVLIMFALSSCSQKQSHVKSDFIIGSGQMPSVVKDKENNLHVVYGSGDSIMYTDSRDLGNSFSQPSVVFVLSELAASHTRGPQIAETTLGLTIVACNSSGNIFSFNKIKSGNWQQAGKVNDVDTTAKENLLALGGDEENAFAVWLDVRENKRNKIYGAWSIDAGKNWSKNILVYASPDTSVCECCKPSVVVKGDNVFVMFRNWLHGNRDLYLIQSTNGGKSFGEAGKLGTGNWALNGCPMDGGGLAINQNNVIQTVWRRKGKIYTAIPGEPETEIGEGRSCTVETVNTKNVYAWTENENIVVMKSDGQRKILGKGMLPILKALNNEHVICIWENDKQIHGAILQL